MRKFYFLLSLFLLCSVNFYSCKTSDEVKTTDEEKTPITSATSTDKMLSVVSNEDGLFITKKHSSKFTHISIFIENSKEFQTTILTDEQTNEFLYPFVKSGETYKIYITLMDSNYKNWNQSKSVTVTAVGGKGELYSDYSYDEENVQIVLNDCNFESYSDIEFSSFTGMIYLLKNGSVDYNSGSWGNFNSFSDKIDMTPRYNTFCSKDFYAEIYTNVEYKNQSLKLSIFGGKGYFSDSHSIKNITNESGVMRPSFNPRISDYKICAAPNKVNLTVTDSNSKSSIHTLDFSNSETQTLEIENQKITFTRENEAFVFGGETYYQTFYDDFSGTELNPKNWKHSTEEERQSSQQNHGWWKDECAYIENGNLVIDAKTKNGKNISGSVYTQGLFEQSHGYYEIRFKCDKTSGLWYAFWLMGHNDEAHVDGYATDAAEIDCFELIPNDWTKKNRFQTALNWDAYGDEQKSKYKITYLDDSFYNDYHTFVFIWGKTTYDAYLDGTLLWSIDASQKDYEHFGGMCEGTNWIIISSEFGSWGGEFDESLLPSKMYVDYVKCGLGLES